VLPWARKVRGARDPSLTRPCAFGPPCEPQEALAAGGAYGILEGRTGALVHPAMMGFLFAASGYAGYLGFQWRRVRTIPEEVAALKAQMPKVPAGGARPSWHALCWHAKRCLRGAVALTRTPIPAAEAAAAPTAAEKELTAQIEALNAERKELMAESPREKHFNWGSLLLALGVAIAIEGPVNTYLRTGKLFPGPHLYAGAGIVVLWAAAAACVPQMQKGNDTARSAHIALNAINMGLFAWQVRWRADVRLDDVLRRPDVLCHVRADSDGPGDRGQGARCNAACACVRTACLSCLLFVSLAFFSFAGVPVHAVARWRRGCACTCASLTMFVCRCAALRRP
jgi:hypothetical protein